MARKESLQEALANVSAPEDFPPQLSDLAILDSSLRCPICHDLFTSPVILSRADGSCSHAFCSSCIRVALSLSTSSRSNVRTAGTGGVGGSMKCPICGLAADEGSLRRVPALDEAVVAWKKARSMISDLVKQAASSSSASGANGKKRKVHGEEEEVVDTGRRSTRSASAAAAVNGKSAKKQKQVADDRSSDIEILDGDPDDPDTLVDCPICGKRIKNSEQDVHVTRCLSKGTSASASAGWSFLSQRPVSSRASKAPTTATEQRLPSTNYNNVKPAALKQAMAELGVPVEKRGEKDLAYLIRRHQTYTLMHNANLDADPKRRKTQGELRRDLEEWDRRFAAAGAGEKKDEDGPLANEGTMKRHEKKYEGQFGELIRLAREGEMKRREAKKTVRLATPPPDPEPEYVSDSSPSSSSHPDLEPDEDAGPEGKEPTPPRPATPPFPSTFLPSHSNPGVSPPPSPSGLGEDIPLERAPEIDPFEQQLSRAGPYEEWKVPAPSQNFGVRREGMGFNDEGRDKGLEGGTTRKRERVLTEVVEEEEDA